MGRIFKTGLADTEITHKTFQNFTPKIIILIILYVITEKLEN